MTGVWGGRVRICGNDGENEGVGEADETPDGEERMRMFRRRTDFGVERRRAFMWLMR